MQKKKDIFDNAVSSNTNGLIVDINQTQRWYKDGLLHRIGAPAILYKAGTTMWFQYGLRHRENGPAIEWHDKSILEYYQNGVRHRVDGPAIEFKSGEKEWWFKNKFIFRTHGSIEHVDHQTFAMLTEGL